MLSTDIDLRELSGVDYLPIVIDHGSGMCKAGFAGEDLPRVVIPTVVAHLSLEEEQEWEQYLQATHSGRSSSTGLYRRQGTVSMLSKKTNLVQDKRVPERNNTPSSMITTGSSRTIDTEANQEHYTIVGDEAVGIDRSNSSVSFSANSYTFNSTQSKNINSKRDSKPFSSLSFPMKNGIVGSEDLTDWDDMEKIWEEIFSHSSMNSPPEGQPVLFSECAENPKSNREKIAEIMFEKYKVPALYFAYKPVLSLYASGKTTGLVLQMGHNVTQAVPIYEGFALSHAIVRMNFGGANLTEYLKSQLSYRLANDPIQNKIDLHSIGGHKIVTDIKEKCCQVSLNYDKDKTSVYEREYVLPDRSVLRIGHELYSTPEVLFNPSLIGRTDVLGIHEAVLNVYDKCDGYVKNLLCQNILLAGGNSNFPYLKSRLSAELNYVYSSKLGMNSMNLLGVNDDSLPMKVKDPRERVMSSWTGGSILASLPMFQQLWVSKGDYDDLKSQALFSKCY